MVGAGGRRGELGAGRWGLGEDSRLQLLAACACLVPKDCRMWLAGSPAAMLWLRLCQHLHHCSRHVSSWVPEMPCCLMHSSISVLLWGSGAESQP